MDLFCFFSEKYDRAVEIYSNWGCFLPSGKELNLCCDRIEELDWRRYAGKKHFAFLASSDGHDSNAGEANLTRPMRQMAHYAGSGRVAVFADSLTRSGVFDAIYNRHCYATTGAPILLTFSLNSADMDEVLTENTDLLHFRVHTICPETIERITVWRNSECVQSVSPYGKTEFEWTFDQKAEPGSYYAEVIQCDHEYAWSSPILYKTDGE